MLKPGDLCTFNFKNPKQSIDIEGPWYVSGTNFPNGYKVRSEDLASKPKINLANNKTTGHIVEFLESDFDLCYIPALDLYIIFLPLRKLP
jgi:hypothetical protein